MEARKVHMIRLKERGGGSKSVRGGKTNKEEKGESQKEIIKIQTRVL